MFMTVLALILANSPLAEAYASFFHTEIAFNVGNWKLSKGFFPWCV
jgi:NhaA family Na+:H+ antiporter